MENNKFNLMWKFLPKLLIRILFYLGSIGFYLWFLIYFIFVGLLSFLPVLALFFVNLYLKKKTKLEPSIRQIIILIIILSSFYFTRSDLLFVLHKFNPRSDGFYGLIITREEKYFYQKLKELKPFNPSGKENVSLKELTNFEWDEVEASNSYSPTEEETYLVFYKDGKKVQRIDSYGFYRYKLVNDGGWVWFIGNTKLINNIVQSGEFESKVKIAKEVKPYQIFYQIIFINN